MRGGRITFDNMHIMSGYIICNGMTWFRADFHLHPKSYYRITLFLM